MHPPRGAASSAVPAALASSAVVAALAAGVVGPARAQAAAAPSPTALEASLDRCAGVAAEGARLACYDALVRSRRDAAAADATVPSRVERLWDLDDAASRGPFALLPHEPNYVLPVRWQSAPNQRPFPPQILDVDEVEAKFQFSFKLKLLEEPAGLPGALWLTYTQKSFWQVYNGDQSAPFRETNFNPGLSYALPATWRFLGLQGRALALTVDHESNGRGAGLTRSWNRLAATTVFERGAFVGAASAWLVQGTDDNPDITDYLGHAALQLGWHRGGHALTLRVRNPLDFDDGRLGAEAAWSFPLPFTRRVKGYVQYDYGYGESLLDYDATGSRIGIGIALTDGL